MLFEDAEPDEIIPPRKEPTAGEPPRARRGRPSRAGIEAELRDQLETLIRLSAIAWIARGDQVCPVVLNNQASLIAADIAKLAAKSKWARKYIEKTLQAGQWLPLMMHTLPVIQAINEHHIRPRMTGTETGTEDTGNAGTDFMG